MSFRSKAYISSFVLAIACFVPGVASAQPVHISVGMGVGMNAEPNGPSGSPSVGGDGRFVAFESDATNLVPDDTNGVKDVFVRDRQANTTTRVSVATGGAQATRASSMPQISANGRFVVFASAAALVADDTHTCDVVTDPCSDIYVHDRDNATTSRVSVVTGGAQANNGSNNPRISGDGRYVIFYSMATNLVANDTNGLPDTFLHDRLSGATTRVSLSTDGTQLEFGSATPAHISTDGSIIVYRGVLAAANRPDPETCAGEPQCGAIWLLERETNVRTLLSPLLPKDTAGVDFGNPQQTALTISRDGRFLLIEQSSSRLRPLGFRVRQSLLDRTTMRITSTPWHDSMPGSVRIWAALSDDGRVMATGGPLGTYTLVDRRNGIEDVLSAEGVLELSLGADARTVAIMSRENLDGSASPLQNRIWVLDRDTDDDLMTDAWETTFGLDINAFGDGVVDSDGDGLSNLWEHETGSHPKATATRYFAEGAANAFFSTRLATLNPNASAATVVYRFLGSDGQTSSVTRTLPAESRTTLDLLANGPAPANDFSTIVESNQPLVVDRTMTWDSTGFGSHAETSVAAPSTTWYLAEGATHGAFDLFYLIQNPGAAAASVQITYMRLAPNTPIVKSYDVEPHSRLTIPVDGEDAGLQETDVAASITSTQPIIVERAMYASAPGEPFRAGHGGAGVTAPATHWYLAEGATGTFFDMYVLVANPGDAASAIKVTYLLPSGETISKTHEVGAKNRLTLTVAGEDARLADTPVSVIVETTNAQPVVVERAMWWPKGQWYEAHLVAGATQTGTRWALADGQAGSELDSQLQPTRPVDTYILIANTSATAGSATVKLFVEGSSTPLEFTVPLKANSRENFPTTGLFEPNTLKRFSAIVESNGVPIVVERAMYTTINGLTWSAGTASLATRLQ
jgi:hypothetical protein